MTFDLSSIRAALPDVDSVQKLGKQHPKPEKVNIKKHIKDAKLWQVHAASDREVVLVSSVDNILCKIDFSEKKPKVALSNPEKGIKYTLSTVSLPKITEFTLSNGQVHEEDEPFQACEHVQRFVLRKRDQLSVYEVTDKGINKLMSTDSIGQSELLGCAGNYLIMSKATTDHKIQLLAYGKMVITSMEWLEMYPTNSLALTRLSDKMLVVVDGNELKAYSVVPFFQTIFRHKLSKNIVSYVFSDSRIACLCENGKLYTWNLKH